MTSIPVWLGAIVALFGIAGALGAAVAVYRTTLYSADLNTEKQRTESLRGDITDRDRRLEDAVRKYEQAEFEANRHYDLLQTKLEGEIKVLRVAYDATVARVKVLEDLLTKRKDDDEIRSEIAAVRRVVDENVLAQLSAILSFVEVAHGEP